MQVEKLKTFLNGYGVELKYFDIEEGEEANLMFLYRKELEENKDLLSPEDLDLLHQYDLKAIELYEKYKDYDTEAVDWLKDTVEIAKANLQKQVK